MRKFWFLLTVLVLSGVIGSAVCFAKPKKEGKKPQDVQEQAKQSPEQMQAEKEKNILVQNINGLRNQELRVAILQQLLNEENAKLIQIQAVFCDQYKLDPDKFRQGKYQYDAASGKFTEKSQ